MPNVQLLIDVMEQIESDPAGFDQRRWTYCFAGRALRMAGAHLELEETPPYGQAIVMDGRQLWITEIEGRARELLELSPAEADSLFHGGNTVEDLSEIVHKLISAEAPTVAIEKVTVGALEEATQ